MQGGLVDRITVLLIAVAAMLLTACGAPAPPEPARSAAEVRQTERALSGVAPLPTIDQAALPTQPALEQPTMPSLDPAIDIDPLLVPDDDPRAIGDPAAPITIYEFSDFECPFCARYANETAGRIKAEYVATGQVRLVFRDYPLNIHPSAETAAVASRCAAAQEQFWPMYELLFATQGQRWGGDPTQDREMMVAFADELNLDATAFAQCMDDPSVAQAVRTEAALAEQLGINSTPNFLINGQVIRGALPFEAFQEAIEGVGE